MMLKRNTCFLCPYALYWGINPYLCVFCFKFHVFSPRSLLDVPMILDFANGELLYLYLTTLPHTANL